MDFSTLNDQEIKALLMQYDSEMRKLNFQMQVVQSTIQKLHESLNPTVSELTQEPVSTLSIPKTDQINEVPVLSTVKLVEYPKKRTPKIDLGVKIKLSGNNGSETVNKENNEPKKRGPKPKNKPISNPLENNGPKKRGPKPKIKAELKEPKKRGPKPKVKTMENGLDKTLKSKRKYTKENPWPEFVLKTLTKYGHLMNSAQLYELAEEENNLQKYGMEIKELRAMVSRAFHQLSNNKKEIVKFDIKGSKSYNYGLSAWLNEAGKIEDTYLP